MNTFVVKAADALGLIPRWHGLRLVAGDASVLMPAIRPCFTKRFHAKADQRLFALYLPGAELTLHASVHGAEGAERQMLFESLSCLGPDDVLSFASGPTKYTSIRQAINAVLPFLRPMLRYARHVPAGLASTPRMRSF